MRYLIGEVDTDAMTVILDLIYFVGFEQENLVQNHDDFWCRAFFSIKLASPVYVVSEFII